MSTSTAPAVRSLTDTSPQSPSRNGPAPPALRRPRGTHTPATPESGRGGTPLCERPRTPPPLTLQAGSCRYAGSTPSAHVHRRRPPIGRAHVRTPVTNPHPVCPPPPEPPTPTPPPPP